jgi:hypothetical protein
MKRLAHKLENNQRKDPKAQRRKDFRAGKNIGRKFSNENFPYLLGVFAPRRLCVKIFAVN